MPPVLRLATCGLAAAWDPDEARAVPRSDCARVEEREARIEWKGARVWDESTDSLRRMDGSKMKNS